MGRDGKWILRTITLPKLVNIETNDQRVELAGKHSLIIISKYCSYIDRI